MLDSCGIIISEIWDTNAALSRQSSAQTIECTSHVYWDHSAEALNTDSAQGLGMCRLSNFNYGRYELSCTHRGGIVLRYTASGSNWATTTTHPNPSLSSRRYVPPMCCTSLNSEASILGDIDVVDSRSQPIPYNIKANEVCQIGDC